ncbi:MAG: hypothetical protein R3C56_18625 [Pirellulaceae bacterium]
MDTTASPSRFAGRLPGDSCLILERYALANLTRQEWPSQSERPFQKLQLLREQILHAAASSSIASETQETFTAFQLAQVRGWSPEDLVHLDRSQWTQLFKEINAFSGIERRRVFHLAYERKYRNDALDALLLHRRAPIVNGSRCLFRYGGGGRCESGEHAACFSDCVLHRRSRRVISPAFGRV